MSISKILSRAAVVFGLLGLVPQLHAQYPYGPGGQHHTPRPDGFIDPDGFFADQGQPFVDPGVFDYDFQVFSPADVTAFGDAPAPKTGFFFTYDRVVFDLGRPDGRPGIAIEGNSSPWESDATWGNRWDFGYMTEADHGWLFSFVRISGVTTLQESIVTNLDFRTLDVEYWGGEINKTYRMYLDDGAIFEPFMGARYIWFREIARDTAPSNVNTNDQFEQRVKNQLLGFQVGSRLFKQKGHWTLSAEGRAVAAQNYQFNQTVILVNPGTFDTLDENLDEFAPYGELRFEAMYNLTRDFALRAGVQVMYFPTGIARPSPDDVDLQPAGFLQSIEPGNDQDMFLGGFTFGFVWNR